MTQKMKMKRNCSGHWSAVSCQHDQTDNRRISNQLTDQLRPTVTDVAH